LTHLERRPIDVRIARQQHKEYESLLLRLGATVRSLPADDAYPDAIFVEDTALVLDEVAIILRPGAASRRGETAAIETALGRYRALRHLRAPAQMDGGDVLRLGKDLFVGASSRSNAAAVLQVRDIVEPLGYAVHAVPVRGALHLKSAASVLTDNVVLLNPRMANETVFHGFEVLRVHPDEPLAANALCVGDAIVYPAAFPRTAAMLRARGLALQILDASELAKAEGALTCCSLLFAEAPARADSREQQPHA
jgi:dimethylargininase